MAPRSLWTGSITFGLVNVPVRIYSAVHEHKLDFHLVHEKDDGPIGYQKVCKLEDKPVSNDEIVKAYEFKKGEFVQLTDEDFEAVQVEGRHTIDLQDFVPYEDIDPTYFAHTYLVGPQDGAEKTYALLVKAMEQSELSAIARYVFHDKQQLGALRIREGLITLENMYFADEIRPTEGIAPKRLPAVDDRELEMAVTLIERFRSDFEHERYEDVYRDRLLKVIAQKRKGKEVHAPPAEEREAPPDLLAALRASVEAAKGANGGRKRSSRQSTAKKRSTKKRTTSRR
jgi:DNA end-binding protein Ku